MSEDITYCMNKCNDMKCFRNKKHIKLLIPHSFSFLEGTEDCHKMQKRRKENKDYDRTNKNLCNLHRK